VSSFLNMLKRMDVAIEEARQRKIKHVTVDARDLHELLRMFRDADNAMRLQYPPHVKMMADAAQAALPHLQGTYATDIARALDYSRPGWRTR
jgi:hypothetical protein